MTLYELGLEYDEAADRLTEIIQKYRQEIKGLPPNSHRAYTLKLRLQDYVVQRGHMREVAHHLKNYYKRSS